MPRRPLTVADLAVRTRRDESIAAFVLGLLFVAAIVVGAVATHARTEAAINYPIGDLP